MNIRNRAIYTSTPVHNGTGCTQTKREATRWRRWRTTRVWRETWLMSTWLPWWRHACRHHTTTSSSSSSSSRLRRRCSCTPSTRQTVTTSNSSYNDVVSPTSVAHTYLDNLKVSTKFFSHYTSVLMLVIISADHCRRGVRFLLPFVCVSGLFFLHDISKIWCSYDHQTWLKII